MASGSNHSWEQVTPSRPVFGAFQCSQPTQVEEPTAYQVRVPQPSLVLRVRSYRYGAMMDSTPGLQAWEWNTAETGTHAKKKKKDFISVFVNEYTQYVLQLCIVQVMQCYVFLLYHSTVYFLVSDCPGSDSKLSHNARLRHKMSEF